MRRKFNPPLGFMFQMFVTIAIIAAAFSGCSMQQKENAQATTEAITEPTIATQADASFASPQSQAIGAYQELLKSCPAVEGEHDELSDPAFGYEENLGKFGKHYDFFAVSDLNHDDVPELLAMTIINNRWTPVCVFTFNAANGEIILLKDSLDPESHATFEQMSTAGGAYDLYICKDNHIHNVWSGDTPVGFQEENHAYTLNGAELEAVACSLGTSGEAGTNVVHFWDMANKNTEENRNAISY